MTQRALRECVQHKPLCQCTEVYEAFEGELEGCDLSLPAALANDFDMCARSSCKSATETLL